MYDEEQVYRHIRKFVKGKSETRRFHNKNKGKNIDIVTSTESIYREVAVHNTIGLFKTDIGLTVDERSLRVELISVGDRDDDLMAEIMATVAFEIMDSGSCYRGKIYKNAVAVYDATYDAKHIILLDPVFWEYEPLKVEDYIITWLLLIPISDEELRFLEENGIPALEELLSEQSTDITNRKRKSILIDSMPKNDYN